MSERLYVATRKGLFILARRGDEWGILQRAFVGNNVSMVLPDSRTGRLYAALNHGHFGCKLHVSADGGQRWEEIATPAWRPMPPGYEEPPNPMTGKPTPWRLELIWSLEAGGSDQPGRLWCGAIPAGLFRSDDDGRSWQLVESLWNRPERIEWFGGGYDHAGIHSICVDPRDSRRIAVGVSCGGVWVSEDDGQSWCCRAEGMVAAYMPPERQRDPNIQDPHRLVQCPAAPDAYWVQHHNGIFRTTDGCASWADLGTVEPSAFGFAVAVHPQDPQTAWFVPAVSDECRVPRDGRVVVTRTRDGGTSFEILDRGLPQRDAYDLVLRHALDVAADGRTLAFGSTTGSLWVSMDGGDRWRLLSGHLPPIYAVRFGATM